MRCNIRTAAWSHVLLLANTALFTVRLCGRKRLRTFWITEGYD